MNVSSSSLTTVISMLSIFRHDGSCFPRGLGGGYSGFQVTGMIEWGQKSKPQKSLGLQTKPKKIPGPKFNPQKLQCRISEP